MHRETHPFNLPLPKDWPRRVRSAVLHALSLARLVVTFVRSWAAKRLGRRNPDIWQKDQGVREASFPLPFSLASDSEATVCCRFSDRNGLFNSVAYPTGIVCSS